MRRTLKNSHLLLLLSIVSSTPTITWGSISTAPVTKRLSFVDASQIALSTAEPELIPLEVNEADALLFEQTLTQISLGTDNTNAQTAPLRLNNLSANAYFSFSPTTANEPVAFINKPGLFLLPYLTQQLAHISIAAFIFTEANGQLKQRSLPPVPADWESLKKELERLQFSHVSLQTNGVIAATGSDGKNYQALMDYSVSKGNSTANTLTFTPASDVNSDGFADINVNYPNGDRQTLMLFPHYAKAFVLKSATDVTAANAYLLATTDPAVVEIDLSSNEYKGDDITLKDFAPGDKIRFSLQDGVVNTGDGVQNSNLKVTSATANEYFSSLLTDNTQLTDLIIHEGSQSVITLTSHVVDVKQASTQENSLHINLTGGIKNKDLLFEFF